MASDRTRWPRSARGFHVTPRTVGGNAHQPARPAPEKGNLCAVTVLLSWQGALMSMVVLIALWLVFLAFLVVARPDTGTLRGLPRMLPDTLRVVGRLARDRNVPR